MMAESMIPKSGYRFSEKIMLKQQAKAKYRIDLKSFRLSALHQRVWEMNIGAADFEHSGREASDDDILCVDVSDAALEAAAMASVPGGAMSFPNAPTVSILVVCCSFDGP
jgi:hypothetical protein